jgi:predicted nucleic acid-binding protein
MTPADQFKRTIYDAACLEPARRHGLPVATFDRDLAKAAKAGGVNVLGLSE